MRQLIRGSQGGHPATPKINASISQYSTDGFAVSIEVKIAPICGACGGVKRRIIGALWICPHCNPDPAAAIPVTAEGKAVIDIEPVKEAKAA